MTLRPACSTLRATQQDPASKQKHKSKEPNLNPTGPEDSTEDTRVSGNYQERIHSLPFPHARARTSQSLEATETSDSLPHTEIRVPSRAGRILDPHLSMQPSCMYQQHIPKVCFSFLIFQCLVFILACMSHDSFAFVYVFIAQSGFRAIVYASPLSLYKAGCISYFSSYSNVAQSSLFLFF